MTFHIPPCASDVSFSILLTLAIFEHRDKDRGQGRAFHLHKQTGPDRLLALKAMEVKIFLAWKSHPKQPSRLEHPKQQTREFPMLLLVAAAWSLSSFQDRRQSCIRLMSQYKRVEK